MIDEDQLGLMGSTWTSQGIDGRAFGLMLRDGVKELSSGLRTLCFGLNGILCIADSRIVFARRSGDG